MPLGMPEFVENPETRCPVILLLDVSGSMSGKPLQELNRGLAAFQQDVSQDAQASLSVEVAIVTFGPVQLSQDFVTIDNFTPPELEPEGLTPMGGAIEYALDLLENRKTIYKNNGISYYRPWVFLITDGAPTDDWSQAAKRLQDAESNRGLCFFAVGVEGADFDTLKRISPERPPVKLNGLDFRSLFVWLSASMKRVSSGKVGEAVALPPVAWGQITS
ncbi:VWA domain-containing protein [Chrysosporum bergii ANA360D]|uniref:VWA domain-containing protein n=1 Tax=Chrysosporum bergii ANA360D TaxID=617107 RepID=A0AA43KD41_9CYAN|nr:VWA domain-containing protein [Chrysosporum bergii]MDH6062097.1 VWA domain-containing protein [Chrysosporum bergii ANA360D]